MEFAEINECNPAARRDCCWSGEWNEMAFRKRELVGEWSDGECNEQVNFVSLKSESIPATSIHSAFFKSTNETEFKNKLN